MGVEQCVEQEEGCGFKFHHEVHTDGISVSILYSRSKPQQKHKIRANPDDTVNRLPLSSNVGLDPGKRNIVTMIDSNGRSLRYTAKQRTFESKLE